METHQGKTIERIVRQKGHSISDLARLTKINRRFVYHWFSQRQLNIELIYKIGNAIGYDFSIVFPDLQHGDRHPDVLIENDDTKLLNSTPIDAQVLKYKYLKLLEEYNKLLIEH